MYNKHLNNLDVSNSIRVQNLFILINLAQNIMYNLYLNVLSYYISIPFSAKYLLFASAEVEAP